MHVDLTGKTALVTGSTRGIGFAIARGLAESGARVAVNGRSEASVEKAIAELRADLPDAELVAAPADVATEEGSLAIHRLLPEIDILVNNLGIYGAQEPLEITDDDWRRYFEVNVLTTARLTRLYLPGMTDRGWGRVLFIASDAAVGITPEMLHYAVSKTALLGIARGFAKVASGTGVTVNSVIVGPTHTDGAESFVHQMVEGDLPWEEAEREFMRLHRPNSLLRRFIEPVEVAHMVTYLSSPLASATTGGAIRVDGGYVDSIVP
jgi:NAD(P)-dependent dehydrogenase (short-subunit alcohol dehydrogenase family)